MQISGEQSKRKKFYPLAKITSVLLVGGLSLFVASKVIQKKTSKKEKTFQKSLNQFVSKIDPKEIILLSTKENVAPLPEKLGVFFEAMGSRVKDLKFRGSYVGIFHQGKLVAEKLNNEGSVELNNPPALKKNHGNFN